MDSVAIENNNREDTMPKKENTIQATIKFPESIHEALKLLKNSEDIPERSINDLVVRIVDEWISDNVELMEKVHNKTGKLISRYKQE